MLKFSVDSPSVIWTNTPISVPLGAISKMMFLLGSERSTLLTNIAGVPLKMPSGSNVMLYQLTRPRSTAAVSPLAAGVAGVVVVGIDLADHRVEVEEDAGLAGRRIDAVDHARAVDRASGGIVARAAGDRVDSVAEDAAGSGRDRDDVAAERRCSASAPTPT